MAAIRVVVSGTGNMGREVLAALCREADVEPVGVLEKFSKEEFLSLPDGSGLIPLGTDPEGLLGRCRPDVVVDFTNADWAPLVAKAALGVGARPVIGTSGLPASFVSDLARQCKERQLGAVVVPNFALGAVLMIHLARTVAPYYDYVEITEMHQERKVDAPSGTAVATALALVEARGRPIEHNEPEKTPLPGSRGADLDGVAIHSVRLPGLVAHQEITFGGRGETLKIRHDSTGRDSFIPGVLLAVREVMKRSELVVGLDGLIGI
jgi:4-hydroxy-tetrahydrodipicolinate reductase